ncbi:MAG: hypothetical protein JO234_09760, partial [Hyphomicrobiales bacterium]|nr:hypothetical protein [Hyphomicrobiales bacterium]
ATSMSVWPSTFGILNTIDFLLTPLSSLSRGAAFQIADSTQARPGVSGNERAPPSVARNLAIDPDNRFASKSVILARFEQWLAVFGAGFAHPNVTRR